MFSLRSLALVGFTIYMLPTDPAQQQRFAEHASTAAHWVSTYCDRNVTSCDIAARAWVDMKDKASFGFALAYDMAMRHTGRDQAGREQTGREQTGRDGIEPEDLGARQVTPANFEAMKPRRSPGTLTADDLRPLWRGHPQP